jgi:hypothetical protein
MFSQHAELYKASLFCSREILQWRRIDRYHKEYVQKLNNPLPVGRTEMQQFEDDDWSEDAPGALCFTMCVNRPSYVYFEHEPGPALVKVSPRKTPCGRAKQS